MENNSLTQSELTVIASDITIEGTLSVSKEIHVFGKIVGEIRGKDGSLLIIKEGALVEGRIDGDTIIVDGFAKGEIKANRKIHITSLGKVIGSVHTPSLQVDPGAIFEAKVEM